MTHIKRIDEMANSRNENSFYGVPELTVIYHGEYSDPEVTDGKLKCNYHELEDKLYAEWSFDTKCDDEDKFDEYMETKEGKLNALDLFYDICLDR